MSIVPEARRERSIHYTRVLAELVRAAELRGVTTYQDIAVIMGLPMQGNHMGRETGRLLGEISRDEVQASRPMLSSVVVGVSGEPGPGFFALARELGLLQSAEDDHAFWESERDRTYVTWRRDLPGAATAPES